MGVLFNAKGLELEDKLKAKVMTVFCAKYSEVVSNYSLLSRSLHPEWCQPLH